MITVIQIVIFFIFIPWLALINRRYYYKNRLIKSIPHAKNMNQYQSGICEMKRVIADDENKRYNDFFLWGNNSRWFALKSILYMIANKRYFAYNQFPVVYVSSYGNISEVSRRRFSSSDAIKVLQELRERMIDALNNNDVGSIIMVLANVYRTMYDVYAEDDVGNMRIKTLYSAVFNVSDFVEKKDIVNAYIYWRNIESEMASMSDLEVIIFGAIRLRLEKYIISYKYPIDQSVIVGDINDFESILKLLKVWLKEKKLKYFPIFERAKMYYMIDILGSGLK